MFSNLAGCNPKPQAIFAYKIPPIDYMALGSDIKTQTLALFLTLSPKPNCWILALSPE